MGGRGRWGVYSPASPSPGHCGARPQLLPDGLHPVLGLRVQVPNLPLSLRPRGGDSTQLFQPQGTERALWFPSLL